MEALARSRGGEWRSLGILPGERDALALFGFDPAPASGTLKVYGEAAPATPFGAARAGQRLSPGIHYFATDGGGAYRVEPSWNRFVPETARDGSGWYREGRAADVLAAVFPSFFSSGERAAALMRLDRDLAAEARKAALRFSDEPSRRAEALSRRSQLAYVTAPLGSMGVRQRADGDFLECAASLGWRDASWWACLFGGLLLREAYERAAVRHFLVPAERFVDLETGVEVEQSCGIPVLRPSFAPAAFLDDAVGRVALPARPRTD